MQRVQTLDLAPGRVIGGAYVVESCLGSGWEGEVYKVVERRTGAFRAAKVFYPQRNPQDRAAGYYARKLELLRDCPLLLRYHHSESVRYRGLVLTALISEYVDGVLLEELIASQPGRRLHVFEALHVLHELLRGLEPIHARREYHGDLHPRNVLVQRRGLRFELKLVDMFDRGRPCAANRREDLLDSVRLLYDMLGGARRYRLLRPEIKAICCGLKRSLVLQRFPTVRHLREHLENLAWD